MSITAGVRSLPANKPPIILAIRSRNMDEVNLAPTRLSVPPMRAFGDAPLAPSLAEH
jgi:hypothetical protein